MRFAVAALSGVLSLVPAQQFRSSVNTVEIYATVVDRSGRAVPDLTRDDFEILDNSQPQKIDVFDAGTQPITMALMIDESPSVTPAIDRIRSAVAEFSRHFLPEDRAAVGAFSHIVRLNPALSSMPADRIDEVVSGRPRFPAGTALWDALDEARAALRTESGRRVVLMLTDGDDNCSTTDMAEVAGRVEREGTMVYAIGVRGNRGLPVGELRTIARDSGGYYFELRRDDDLPATLARVADELHRQYLLGFTPASMDGRSHELTVRAKRSGLTVRARRSYVAQANRSGEAR